MLAAAGATASALVLRYWLAAHMESDQAVQLYPRTTAQQILYCLLVLTGLAVLLIVERGRTWAAARFPLANGASPAAHPGPVGWRTALGVLCGLGLLFGMAGSATAMRYMPDTTESSSGRLAWMAHSLRNPDGQCSANAPGGTCENYDTDLENLISEESTNELVCFTYVGFPTNP